MKLRVMVLAMLLSMAPVWAAACDGMGAKGAAHSANATAHSSQVAQKGAGAQCPHMKDGASKHQCPHAKDGSAAAMTEGKGCCCKGKDGAMAEGKGCCKGKCPRHKPASEKRT